MNDRTRMTGILEESTAERKSSSLTSNTRSCKGSGRRGPTLSGVKASGTGTEGGGGGVALEDCNKIVREVYTVQFKNRPALRGDIPQQNGIVLVTYCRFRGRRLSHSCKPTCSPSRYSRDACGIARHETFGQAADGTVHGPD